MNAMAHLSSKQIHLIQAPIALGQGLEGVDEAPEILLKGGLREQIESLGWQIQQIDTVESEVLKWDSPIATLPAHQVGSKIKFPKELGEACEKIALIAQSAHHQKNFTLTLGGDHSVAIGSIGGALLARPHLGVIWVDAHADFNTPETSPSGNIHGMPLAFLSGFMQRYKLPSFAWLKNFLSQNQLIMIGLRSIDPGEKALMKSWGAHVFSMSEVDHYGIGGVMDRAKEILLKNGERPLYLSYDIDSVDPHFAPSTGTKVRGGLNYREAHFIAESLAETEALVGMDLVEINPRLGYLDQPLPDRNVTVEIGIELVTSALGKKIY